MAWVGLSRRRLLNLATICDRGAGARAGAWRASWATAREGANQCVRRGMFTSSGSWDSPPPPAEPRSALQPTSDAAARRMARAAVEFVLRDRGRAEGAPACGFGTAWLVSQQGDAVARAEAEARAAYSVCADVDGDGSPPEEGSGDLHAELRAVEQATPASVNYHSGYHFGYIPTGGVFLASVADFIASALHRYTGVYHTAPGLASIESTVTRWLASCIALCNGPRAGGMLTTGSSLATIYALYAAKRSKIEAKDIVKATVYTSTEAHFSVAKGAAIIGVLPEHVRVVPSDAERRIDVAALREAITQDVVEGLIPIAVVASAGTTSTGAVDPMAALADVAEEAGAWLHVDAAYGGVFSLTEHGRDAFAGIERAHSVCFDTHKGMSMPFSVAALLVSDVSMLRHAFGGVTGPYLQPSGRSHLQEDPLAPPEDLMHLSPELTRGFRALRVWLCLRVLGLRAFRTEAQEKLDLARLAADLIDSSPHLQVVDAPQLSIFTFRLRLSAEQQARLSPEDVDEANKQLLIGINDRGRAFLTPLNASDGRAGGFCARIAVLSCNTKERHIRRLAEDANSVAAEILATL